MKQNCVFFGLNTHHVSMIYIILASQILFLFHFILVWLFLVYFIWIDREYKCTFYSAWFKFKHEHICSTLQKKIESQKLYTSQRSTETAHSNSGYRIIEDIHSSIRHKEVSIAIECHKIISGLSERKLRKLYIFHAKNRRCLKIFPV